MKIPGETLYQGQAIIVEYDCPYGTCLWPSCRRTAVGWQTRPKCLASELSATRLVERNIEARPKAKETPA